MVAKILLVGTATLDIVYALNRYPAEDDEMRADGLRLCRGGNAANTAVVLSDLGHQCSFLGVLADAPESSVITTDFARKGVDFSLAPRLPGRPPTSSIYLTGQHRTIVHYRDLPELRYEDFTGIDFTAFDWLHFEGRNVSELLKILCLVKERCPGMPVSLEVEKPRDGMESLLSIPSLLICSKAYAMAQGCGAPFDFLQALRKQAPQAGLVVGWGEKGAFALGVDGREYTSPAFPPERVVDTLGAGDTFNAGLLNVCLNAGGLGRGVEAGCMLAGRKCGMTGFDMG